MAFKINVRSTWTTRRVPSKVKALRKPVAMIEFHHTAGTFKAAATPAQEKAHLRQIEEFHIYKRNMSAIGYNYLIFPSGRVYEGRGWKVGAHDEKHNSEAVGICFVGNYETQTPPTAMMLASRQLIDYLRDRGFIKSGAKCIAHGERRLGGDGSTACPGTKLEAKFRLLYPNPWP